MVEISIEGSALHIEVQGMHKLWALKSALDIPLSDIRGVRHDPDRARGPHGLRFPGTHIPFRYFAGTAYQSDLRPDFWTVGNPDNAIVIQCREDAAFDEIIVEVANPTVAVDTIRAAIARYGVR